MRRTGIRQDNSCSNQQVNSRRLCGIYELKYSKHRKKTLQAQCTPVIIKQSSDCRDDSRKACRYLRDKWRCRKSASLTVEAALCLPVFLFTALMLLAPMKMIDEKRKLQNIMEAAAKDMAQAAYIEKLLEEEGSGFLSGRTGIEDSAEESRNEKRDEKGNASGEITDGIKNGLNTGYTAGRVLTSLNGAVIRTPYFETCEILRSDMIEMELKYDMKLPFSIFGIESVPMSSVVNRRAWTGSEGGRGADRYGSGDMIDGNGYDRDEDGDEVVYIGKTSTVYHKSRHCHYLDNVLKPASGEQIETLRNASGGKYHACESCRPDTSGTVYIMESGTAYHKSSACKAIGAYAQEIKRRDAAHLGGCSYCTKEKY